MSTEKPDRLAYNIEEFCDAVGISRRSFYNLPESDRPLIVSIGSRRIITVHAALDWLARRPVVSASLPPPPV